MPAARETTRAFRVAAAALSSSPVGFAAGALLAARNPAEPISMDGLTVLGYGLAGAMVAALIMALTALTLPPKPVRIATLVAAGASFAILVYMVQDFIRDSIAQSDAVSAAYASMPHYELTLWAKDPRREGILTVHVGFRDAPLHRHAPGRVALPGRGRHGASGGLVRNHADIAARTARRLRPAGVLAHHRRRSRDRHPWLRRIRQRAVRPGGRHGRSHRAEGVLSTHGRQVVIPKRVRA